MKPQVTVWRGHQVESVHQVSAAVVNHQGKLIYQVGDPNFITYIRSAAKPFQALVGLKTGAFDHFGFSEEELAIVCASHSGETVHTAMVHKLLSRIGLDEKALQCGIHPPLHQPTADALKENHISLSPLHNNCSGKHAGMLACVKFLNLPVENYLEPENEVQKRIFKDIQTFSRYKKMIVGIDGCSAPVYGMPLRNMAFLYAQLATESNPHLARIYRVMTQYPLLVGGTGRFDSELMKHVSIVSKVGAEAVHCVGIRKEHSPTRSPLGIAVKCLDGNPRAVPSVIMEILRQLKVVTADQLEALDKFVKPMVTNQVGKNVGRMEVKFHLQKVS
jgi:L-asparaginase II